MEKITIINPIVIFKKSFTNFTGGKNELAFTITYEDNMNDNKALYINFKNFMKRLKYKYPNVEYIMVVEPQERGTWHCHIY